MPPRLSRRKDALLAKPSLSARINIAPKDIMFVDGSATTEALTATPGLDEMVSFGFSTKEEYDAFKKPKYLKVEVIKVENVYGVDSYIPDFIPWTSE